MNKKSEFIIEITSLRSFGLSSYKISKLLNIPASTIRSWLNPNTKEQQKRNTKKWRLNNPEKNKLSQRQTYYKYRDKKLLQNKQWRMDNANYLSDYRLKNQLHRQQDSQQRYQNMMSDLRHRCLNCLAWSKKISDKYGYKHCAATIEELIIAFTGYCYICNIPEIECNSRLHMDHNHVTGEFRGWLCRRCNMNIIGMSNDNPDLLRRAADYLENNLNNINLDKKD